MFAATRTFSARIYTKGNLMDRAYKKVDYFCTTIIKKLKVHSMGKS